MTNPRVLRALEGLLPDLSPVGRVLLADTDRELREGLLAALRLDGADVVVARDGVELLERLGTMSVSRSARARFDLVIAAVRLPGCGGLAVLEGMRRAGWHLPMILMTEQRDRAERARVEEQHAVLFDKPFDVDDLRTAALHFMRPPVKSGTFSVVAPSSPASSQSPLLPPDQLWRRR